jgi:hypothetical protein
VGLVELLAEIIVGGWVLKMQPGFERMRLALNGNKLDVAGSL